MTEQTRDVTHPDVGGSIEIWTLEWAFTDLHMWVGDHSYLLTGHESGNDVYFFEGWVSGEEAGTYTKLDDEQLLELEGDKVLAERIQDWVADKAAG